MSTATVIARSPAFAGTYGAAPVQPSISLLGFVAGELGKLMRKSPAPKADRALTRAEEAEALRRFADEQDDRRFAEDLYAAAARHEELV